MQEKQFDMVYANKHLQHQCPIEYELWRVKGNQYEGMKLEELDQLGQANVLVDAMAKNNLESIPLDHLLINRDVLAPGEL